MSIGKRIEAIRKRDKLTQEAFAAKLGFSRRALHAWEKDEVDPPATILIRIREEFDVDPEWVLSGDGATPLRHFHPINWAAYDETKKEIEKIATEVRLVLAPDQIERLTRIEFADGTKLTGEDRARLTKFLRALALER